jgi:hypothetical protein
MKLRPGLVLTIIAALASASVAFANGGRPLSTTLSGAQEVPGPGDPDGSAAVHLRLNQGQEEVCFEITWNNIAPPTAMHIHEAPVGVAGPVVVTLYSGPPLPGNSYSACVPADADEIKEIRKEPEEYYVNVHNAVYPEGAIRGQLSK